MIGTDRRTKNAILEGHRMTRIWFTIDVILARFAALSVRSVRRRAELAPIVVGELVVARRHRSIAVERRDS
jgi:hypothetical protein